MSILAPAAGILAQLRSSPLMARAESLPHQLRPASSLKEKIAEPVSALMASPDVIALMARADNLRQGLFAAAKRAKKIKIVPPPSVEPGVIACMGSATFLAAGFGLKCAPRVAAGLLTALCVSAPVQILDIAIMENASGKRNLPEGLKAGIERLRSGPIAFLKSQETALVYCLFGATYATANICKATAVNTAGTLLFTTIANMGACFYKDSELARICGKGPRREFPKMGYLNLAMRDMLSMGSTFTLPPVLGTLLKTAGMPSSLASNIAQTSCPVLAQTVQAPFHLMALSYYNSPDFTFSERIQSVKQLYKGTVLARMARALPCYGAGGVLNTNLQTMMVGIFGH